MFHVEHLSMACCAGHKCWPDRRLGQRWLRFARFSVCSRRAGSASPLLQSQSASKLAGSARKLETTAHPSRRQCSAQRILSTTCFVGRKCWPDRRLGQRWVRFARRAKLCRTVHVTFGGFVLSRFCALDFSRSYVGARLPIRVVKEVVAHTPPHLMYRNCPYVS
jgi:hypothetical protein